jgi:hypothetical protein
MRYLVLALIIIHGLIHLMGFSKAFGFADLPQITRPIGKTEGMIWLLAALGFTLTALMMLLRKEGWWTIGMIMVVISQLLIVLNWSSSKYGTIANLLILTACYLAMASARFTGTYYQDVREYLAKSNTKTEAILTENDLSALPDVVQKYIRLTGSVGKPKINNFRIEFQGKLRQTASDPWMPFSSEQYNFVRENARLFFLDAVMKKLPVKGYHRFIDGKASMDIRLFSLWPVQKQAGEKMNISETVTLFNDMCCLAPATLIDDRIQWLKTEGNKVLAEFKPDNIKISAWLHFNDAGELINFVSDDRYALQEDGTLRQFTWSTPLKDYRIIDGYRLAGYAEAIYRYPEGDFCYGTFTPVSVRVNCQELP